MHYSVVDTKLDFILMINLLLRNSSSNCETSKKLIAKQDFSRCSKQK